MLTHCLGVSDSNEHRPLLSVITIVRNNLKGLRKTHASLERQTYQRFEWLIIDGASTDDTASYVQGLLASGKATGVSERDCGIYDAMNKGLERAAGEYILFLNAGDSLFDEFGFVTALRRLEESAWPDIGFFGSWMDFGNTRFLRRAKEPDYIWHGQPALHQASLFRRDLHRKHPFRTTFRISGDYDALARMKMDGARMESFSDILSVNEFDTNSTSNKFKTQLLREAFSIQRHVLGLSWPVCAISFARRSVVSAIAKLLTWAASWRKR